MGCFVLQQQLLARRFALAGTHHGPCPLPPCLPHSSSRARWLAACRCPPGHGDIYPSLLGSGMLDRLLAGELAQHSTAGTA